MSTFIILWLIWACCMAAIIAGKKGHSAVSAAGNCGEGLRMWRRAAPPSAGRRSVFVAGLRSRRAYCGRRCREGARVRLHGR